MYWTCEHCDTEMDNKYDYCTNCEAFGCTADDHKCNEVDLAQAGSTSSLLYIFKCFNGGDQYVT